MIKKIRFRVQWAVPMAFGIGLLALFVSGQQVSAITALPTPAPKPGGYGVEATKTQPPPTVGATISTPGSGATFTSNPQTVSGICPDDLLVQIYDNNVLVGSTVCSNGSFSVQVTLFAGVNELTAIVYDDLEQAGPVSNIMTVTYNDNRLTAFGALITLTSSYGRRSAPAGGSLDWPLQLSGGTGPYAFSIDWGDGSQSDLKSQSLAGLVTISHTFKKAGIYSLNVKATDVNGVSAFLQVVSVASGKVDSSTATTKTDTPTTVETRILWIPALIALVLILPAFWVGRRSEIVSIRNKMLKDREGLEEK